MVYTIRIGDTLTDYANIAIKVERVAAGGMGLVALGPNVMEGGGFTKDEWYVLKTIKPEALEDDPTLRDRFVREGLTWAGIWPHANITTCHGVTVSDGVPFLELDYAKFGSLADLLERDRFSQTLALTFAQHIAAGLAYLHTPDPVYLRPQPLVHRDLKPDNILVDEFGYAMITDFGLVAALQAPQIHQFAGSADEEDIMLEPKATVHFHTQEGLRGMGLGTVTYMAPEQWEGAAGIEADCYALGIILFEVFTGHYPYVLTLPMTRRAWRRMHQEADPVSAHAYVPELPAPIARLIAALLAKDPADRPTAAQTLTELQGGAQALGAEVYSPPEIFAHTPDNERIHWLNWADAYARFHFYDEAMERNDRAFALAPEDVNVLITRGNIFKGQQQWDEAEHWLQQALLVCAPDDAVKCNIIFNQLGNLYSQRGQSLQEQGQIEATLALDAKAEAMYAQGLARMSDAADTWKNRAINQACWGELLREQGETVAGRDHLMQALQCYRKAEALGLREPQLAAALARTERLLAE